MADAKPPISRRRTRGNLPKKTLVYFTEDERRLIDAAAKAERRSISSFIANAAIIAAQKVATPKPRRTD